VIPKDLLQTALHEYRLSAWLLYDFRGQNPLARRIVQFPADGHATRRWFYLIPAQASRASWSIASSPA
jgi:hypothetical protein